MFCNAEHGSGAADATQCVPEADRVAGEDEARNAASWKKRTAGRCAMLYTVSIEYKATFASPEKLPCWLSRVAVGKAGDSNRVLRQEFLTAPRYREYP